MAVTQNKPSKFSVNHVLFNPYCLTIIDELYLYSCANEPNKSPWRERLWALSFERLATSPPQADHVLVDLFFIRGGRGYCVKAPRHLCTPMFIAAQLTIEKCWKQPKCPSVNEWIKKLWYIYTMEFYTAERKKELLPFMTAWMELESIMLVK